MDRETIIRVEGLGKRYTLGVRTRQGYTALRDVLADFGRNVLRRRQVEPAVEVGEFWALRDVSFEVKHGEVVGIIGRNGAGKSTLLKILSRITEPTTGRIKLKGRVASLLEVGTGFHPELTGRENIFLNGAILGMHRAEIKAKFDEIVAFAEVERFLDTPVKRYSSGMYVRLAFAVAAHLEPEILIVDEVLAVGDAEFQKKCLGKMKDVAKGEGRTVIFVSHNMNAIENLCGRALFLQGGTITADSTDVHSLVGQHIKTIGTQQVGQWINENGQFANGWFVPKRFAVRDAHGKNLSAPISNTQDIHIYIEGEFHQMDLALIIGYYLYDASGQLLYISQLTDTTQQQWPQMRMGRLAFISDMPKRFLNEGEYTIRLAISLHYREWLCDPEKDSPCLSFQVQGGLSDSPHWLARRPGVLAPVFQWSQIEPI